MDMKTLIKIGKYIGVTLALLSIIYTSIQIIDYANQSRNRIVANYKYEDLSEFLCTDMDMQQSQERQLWGGEYFKIDKIELLNKYLKTPFPINQTDDKNNDSILNKSINDLKSVFRSPIIKSIIKNKSIVQMTIANVSDKEVKEVKIDISEMIDYNNSFSYFINTNSCSPDIIDVKNQNVIVVGNILPMETKVITILGLVDYMALTNGDMGDSRPRVIFPDGFVNAYGSINVTLTSRFDEWLTNLVIRSNFLQVCIGIFSILGIVYFCLLTVKISRYFFNK